MRGQSKAVGIASPILMWLWEGRLGVRDCGGTRRAAGTMRKDAAELSNVPALNSTFRTKLYESARS